MINNNLKKISMILMGILLMVFMLNLVSANVTVAVGKSSPEAPARTYNDLSPELKSNVNQVQNYITNNYPDLNPNSKDARIFVNWDGAVKFEYKGKTALSIPKGLKITTNNGNMVFSGKVEPIFTPATSGPGGNREIPALVINGKSIGDFKQGYNFYAELEQDNKAGTQKIRVAGAYYHLQFSSWKTEGNTIRENFLLNGIKDATITLDSATGEIKNFDAKFNEQYGGSFTLDGKTYENLKDMSVTLDKNGSISYAKLTSLKGGIYNFEYGGKKFIFSASPKGEIVFDPLGGKVSGENVNLLLEGKIIESKGTTFSANMDKEGNILDISLGKNGKFTEALGNTYTSSKGLNIYFDGRDIKNEKNAVSISADGTSKTALKGEVEITTKLNLHYKGEGNAYTLFDASPNGGKKSFEVKEGNAQIDNGNAKILVKNGEIFLERMIGKNSNAEEFLVKASGEGNKETVADISRSNNDFSVSVKSFVDGKETSTKVIPLSKLHAQVSLSNLLVEDQNKMAEKENAKSNIEKLEKLLEQVKSDSSDPKTKEKIDAIELEIINNKNKLNGNTETTISELRKYLSSGERDESSKMRAQLRLAELIDTKASEKYAEFRALNKKIGPEEMYMLDDVGVELDEIASEAKAIYKELKEKSKGNDENMFIAASFGEANLAVSSGRYSEGIEKYKEIAGSSDYSDVVKSEAMRNAARIAYQTGSRSDAIRFLEESTRIYSGNENSKELELTLQKDYLRKMISSIGGETSQAYEGLLERTTWRRELPSPAYSNSELLSTVNKATSQLNDQQFGIFANLYALDSGLNLNDFYKMDQKQRTDFISDYWLRQGVDPNVNQAFINRLVEGSFSVEKNVNIAADMNFMRDPVTNSKTVLTLDTPNKYITEIFSLKDDLLVYANPVDAAMLAAPFAPVSVGGKVITLGNLAGKGLNAASLGTLGIARASTAEFLGSELLADLSIGTGITVGASYIPGEIPNSGGIKIGELASELSAGITFERLASGAIKKLGSAALKAEGSFVERSGNMVTAFKVVGKDVDDVTADTLTSSGFKILKNDNGEKFIIDTNSLVDTVAEDLGQTELAYLTKEATNKALYERMESTLDQLEKNIAALSRNELPEVAEVSQVLLKKGTSVELAYGGATVKGLIVDSVNAEGKYVVSFTKDGQNIVETMSADKLREIRNSESLISYGEVEMADDVRQLIKEKDMMINYKMDAQCEFFSGCKALENSPFKNCGFPGNACEYPRCRECPQWLQNKLGSFTGSK
ncbi:MAG: hypothetical protein WC979_06820 [Candidatus Pacearchaeota archaeon]|jgi:hypothetical protein